MLKNFSLEFQVDDANYNIQLQEQEAASSKTVHLEGRSYALLGSDHDILWLKENIPELNDHTDISTDQLLSKLVEFGADPLTAKVTHSIGIQTLQVGKKKPPMGKWMQSEVKKLEQGRNNIADKYWEKSAQMLRGQNAQEVPLLKFVKGFSSDPDNLEVKFWSAIENDNQELFRSVFQELSLEQLTSIDMGENLGVFPKLTISNEAVKITQEDISNIRDYIRDTKFSGIVTLSDSYGTYTIPSKNVQNSQAPFSIHSVGKVFTGVLALCMIEKGLITEEDLDNPLQLSPEVIEKLQHAPKVLEQLQNPEITMRKVMLHEGAFGDYLVNYQDKIEEAVNNNQPIPTVNRAEDFLKFADKELVELDNNGQSYSNLGILLVGLSLQHLYNKRSSEEKNFDDLLSELVLTPAGVNLYETHKPDNARYNTDDKAAPHTSGGPAGGAWSTTEDLMRFGDWIANKCEGKDTFFYNLLKKYGGEFFNGSEIDHSGSLYTASAHLTHRLDNRLTIATLSDKTGLGVATGLTRQIKNHLLSKISKVAPKEEVEKGDVIVLVGTSSVGKTTIINSIREIEPDRVEYGSDKTGAEYIYEFMEKNYEKNGISKEDWDHLHNVLISRADHFHIHDAVSGGLFNFRENISIEDQEKAKATAGILTEPVNQLLKELPHIDTIVMDKTLETLNKGKNAIFDILDIDKVHSHAMGSEVNIKSVLVYCPFHTLTERIAKRNLQAIESGNYQEIRAGVFPLFQFAELFGPRKATDTDSDVIDTVTKQTVEDDFESNFNAWVTELKRDNPAKLKQMMKDGSLDKKCTEDKAELLSLLGFTEVDPLNKTVELTPRKQYTHRIESRTPTDGETMAEIAAKNAQHILGNI